MLNINFVPDDYIQSTESRRTNFMYIILFAVVMVALIGSFATIKIRQRALSIKEKLASTKLAKAQSAIGQLEELQAKRKTMMKTALTTASLLETVPRSVLLASLTNNLPPGVSLLQLRLIQKEPKMPPNASQTDKYKAAKNAANQAELPGEKMLEMHIDIDGIAPSDLQVAAYIEQLSSSSLLKNVALVESKENRVPVGGSDSTFRQFKLTAMLAEEVHLNKQDIEKIRARAANISRTF